MGPSSEFVNWSEGDPKSRAKSLDMKKISMSLEPEYNRD